jgi:hypothetical protein
MSVGSLRALFQTASLASWVPLTLAALACSSKAVPPKTVAAAPPPKDDGKPAEGGSGGLVHSQTLEQLKNAKLVARTDKQNSIRLSLPDGENWTQVKFWGVPSLVGFRYGKDHHGIVGAFVTKVENNQVPGVCAKSFESWATPWVEMFEVELAHEAPSAIGWRNTQTPKEPAMIVSIDSIYAKTATALARDGYAGAWAAYPAWPGTCLVVGVAIPARDDEGRAKIARDRFVKDMFPSVELLTPMEPKERY